MRKRLQYIIVLMVLLVFGGAIGLWFGNLGEKSWNRSYDPADSIWIPVIKGSALLDSLRQQMEKDRQAEMDY
ncbi:MAG: hypothetical protein J5502_06220, partial [Prevotella sp.]|nr:hypothetical protein [Prevotella sp.]